MFSPSMHSVDNLSHSLIVLGVRVYDTESYFFVAH